MARKAGSGGRLGYALAAAAIWALVAYALSPFSRPQPSAKLASASFQACAQNTP